MGISQACFAEKVTLRSLCGPAPALLAGERTRVCGRHEAEIVGHRVRWMAAILCVIRQHTETPVLQMVPEIAVRARQQPLEAQATEMWCLHLVQTNLRTPMIQAIFNPNFSDK